MSDPKKHGKPVAELGKIIKTLIEQITYAQKEKEKQMNRLKFIPIGAMLSDIGKGIGEANKNLVTQSKSELGSLAVKTADVTVNFEMTSAAERREDDISMDFPLLGAKTLSFGSETFEEKQINRCTITLNIVAVGPVIEKETPDIIEKPITKPDAIAIPDHAFPQFIAVLEKNISGVKMSPEIEKSVKKDLKDIKEMVGVNKFNEARIAFTHFISKYADINLFKGGIK